MGLRRILQMNDEFTENYDEEFSFGDDTETSVRKSKKDKRRAVENLLEEKRLKKELEDYDYLH